MPTDTLRSETAFDMAEALYAELTEGEAPVVPGRHVPDSHLWPREAVRVVQGLDLRVTARPTSVGVPRDGTVQVGDTAIVRVSLQVAGSPRRDAGAADWSAVDAVPLDDAFVRAVAGMVETAEAEAVRRLHVGALLRDWLEASSGPDRLDFLDAAKRFMEANAIPSEVHAMTEGHAAQVAGFIALYRSGRVSA